MTGPNDTDPRSEAEIRDRLRELHGTYLPKEMGGMIPLGEAEALLWALGYDDPSAADRYPPKKVDVSDYIEGV